MTVAKYASEVIFTTSDLCVISVPDWSVCSVIYDVVSDCRQCWIEPRLESCVWTRKPRVCYFSESGNKLNLDSVNLYVGHNTMGVFCEDLGENWLRYNGTVLYKTLLYTYVLRSWKLCLMLHLTRLSFKHLNPSGAKSRTFWDHSVNSMTADVLALVAMSLAAMVLTV